MFRLLLTLLFALQLAIAPMARAGVTSTVTGADFGDAFRGSFISSVVALGLADVQTGIGDVFNDANGNPIKGGEGSLGHVLLHGLAGCVAAEAQGADCGSGAASAIAGAVYSGMQNAPRREDFQSDSAYNAAFYGWKADVQKRAEWVSLGAAWAASGGKTENLSAGNAIANSVVANNYLFHVEALERAQQKNALRDCIESTRCTPEEIAAIRKRIADLDQLDSARDSALRTACDTQPQGTDCLQRVEELAYAVQWFYDRPDPFGLGDAFVRNWQLDYLNAAMMLRDGMNPNGVPQEMVDEWNESIELLNQYRSSYEAVADARFTNNALIFGIDLATAMMGGSGRLTPRQNALAAELQGRSITVVDRTGTDVGITSAEILARNPRQFGSNSFIDNHGYVYTRNVDGTFSSRVATAPEIRQSGIAIDYSSLSTARAGQRVVPGTELERLAFVQLKANPSVGVPLASLNADARFAVGGFAKAKQHFTGTNGNNFEIHYQYNATTGQVVDIKFTSPMSNSE